MRAVRAVRRRQVLLTASCSCKMASCRLSSQNERPQTRPPGDSSLTPTSARACARVMVLAQEHPAAV